MPIFELARIFLRIGATSFGGQGAALAVIESELVARRGVVTAEAIAEASAGTRILPGSTLIQVVSFLGYRLGGWSGSSVATLAFVFPSAFAMLLLAAFYDALSTLSLFRTATQGSSAAVVGLLLASAYRFGWSMLGDPPTIGIALVAFALAAGLGIPAAAVVVSAGLVGALLLAAPAVRVRRGTEEGGQR
jgi:chromate transporter